MCWYVNIHNTLELFTSHLGHVPTEEVNAVICNIQQCFPKRIPHSDARDPRCQHGSDGAHALILWVLCMIPMVQSAVLSLAQKLQFHCPSGLPQEWERKSLFSLARWQFSWCHKGRRRKIFFSCYFLLLNKRGVFCPSLRLMTVEPAPATGITHSKCL